MNDRTTHSRRALLAAAAGSAGLAACQPRQSKSQNAVTGTEPDALDERFGERIAALPNRSGEVDAVSDAERSQRLERVRAALEQFELDAVVIEPGATLKYLSRVSWRRSERLFALVVCREGEPFWVAPAFEAPRARTAIEEANGPLGDMVGWDEHQYAYEPLAAKLLERGAQRVAVDHQARVFVLEGLARTGRLKVESARALIASVRGIKDRHEVQILRLANELTQQAIHAVSSWLEPGLSDFDLGQLMQRAQEQLGLTGVWVLPLLDDLAALPHGRPAGRQLKPGSRVLVDTGGTLHGYQSDNTRSWVFDAPPDEEFARGWDVVRRAQVAAFEAIRPGARAGDIDRAARAVIDDGGFGEGYEAFAHRLGHGIGMEGHEDPYFDGGSDVILEAGMTFSDEPGIYLPGRFGIRIEDCIVVTESGADHFGTWQLSPRSPK